MKKQTILIVLGLLLSSHDMYFKPGAYFLEPNSAASIELYNGTFERSENTIDRNRMIDVSLVGGGKRLAVDSSQWKEVEGVTVLDFIAGDAGTWVAGLSTYPKNIELAANEFNEYLEHDGVLDMLVWREENGELNSDAIEKYSKHVKTIFQVGETLTDDWKTVLGYPIEFIPLENPYDLHSGHAMKVKLLWQGEPLANQLVYVGSEVESHDHGDGEAHSHEGTEAEADHEHDALQQLRTDAQGVVTFDISHQGVWYLRTIYMALSEEEGLTHESNWATLTFQVGDGHSHHATEVHEHDNEDVWGIPSYVYWVGSLLLLFGLFYWFNKRKG